MSSNLKNSDSIEDFKASFACINNNLDGFFTSPEDLAKALQGCGKNPSQRSIDVYWRSYKKIGLNEFCEIASQEQSLSEKELIEAFRAIDIDGNGFISYKEFMDIFTQEGDPIDPNEARKIMEEADLNNDKKLNYKEFSKLVMETIEKAKREARKQMKKILNENETKRRNYSSDESSIGLRKKSSSRLSFADEVEDNRLNKKGSESSLKSLLKSELQRTRSIDDSFNSLDKKKTNKFFNLFETKFQSYPKILSDFKQPKDMKKWFKKFFNGGIYFNNKQNSIISNSFVLDLPVESSVIFSIEPFLTNLHTNQSLANIDLSILVVKDNKSLKLKGLAENKIQNKWCTRIDLTPGRYFLFPFTTGCHLKPRLPESSKIEPKLFQKDLNKKITLTRQFKDALNVIFDMCDLDSNGRLSQYELNLYSMISANESLSDEEWKFVGDLVGLEKKELTRDGFIELYKMEAKRDDVDLNDIHTRLDNMGFNKSLTIDQSCPFRLEIAAEASDFDLLFGEIWELKTADSFLFQIFESKGITKQIKGFNDINFIQYSNNYWCVLIVQNMSHKDVYVDVDYSESENCISNLNDLMIKNFKVKSMKNKTAIYLSPQNANKDWIFRCSVAINY